MKGFSLVEHIWVKILIQCSVSFLYFMLNTDRGFTAGIKAVVSLLSAYDSPGGHNSASSWLVSDDCSVNCRKSFTFSSAEDCSNFLLPFFSFDTELRWTKWAERKIEGPDAASLQYK